MYNTVKTEMTKILIKEIIKVKIVVTTWMGATSVVFVINVPH